MFVRDLGMQFTLDAKNSILQEKDQKMCAKGKYRSFMVGLFSMFPTIFSELVEKICHLNCKYCFTVRIFGPEFITSYIEISSHIHLQCP